MSVSSELGASTMSSRGPTDRKAGLRARQHSMLIDCSNARYSPHTHRGLTTHLIRSGEMIVTYPGDDSMQKQRFGVGARIDVPADKLHEVTMGKDG